MPLTVEQIKAEERADLADWLWISAAPREEVKAAWDAEIARRIAEIDAGSVEWIPAEEALAKIDGKLRKAGVRKADA